MFEYLVPRPPDAIMALMQQCKADKNPDKIDLGVGVYKDETGQTTILRAVKQAEKQLWEIRSWTGLPARRPQAAQARCV